MPYRKLLETGKTQEHKTSKKEIQDLFHLIERDIKDAALEGLSTDRKFATAYNAALQTAKLVMYCKGFRPRGLSHHMTVFKFLEIALGNKYKEIAEYFDFNRIKRHIIDYDRPYQVSEKEASELLSETKRFYAEIKDWIKEEYPNLY